MTRPSSHVSVSTYYVGAETLRREALAAGFVVSSHGLVSRPETLGPLGHSVFTVSRLSVSTGSGDDAIKKLRELADRLRRGSRQVPGESPPAVPPRHWADTDDDERERESPSANES